MGIDSQLTIIWIVLLVLMLTQAAQFFFLSRIVRRIDIFDRVAYEKLEELFDLVKALDIRMTKLDEELFYTLTNSTPMQLLQHLTEDVDELKDQVEL